MASMKSRKFPIDMPRLKIGTSKVNSIISKERGLFFFESPPPTPKSVRPPLAFNVEAELRSACKNVVENYKPSHENWLVSNPQSDAQHATAFFNPRTVQVRRPTGTSNHASELSFRARQEEVEEVAQARSQRHPDSYVEQFVDSNQFPHQTNHAWSSSDRVNHPAGNVQPSPRYERNYQRYASSRSDMVDTFRSSPQTDSTGYPWSTSTGLTSIVTTPAHSSNWGSFQSRYEPNGAQKNVWVNQEMTQKIADQHHRTVREHSMNSSQELNGTANSSSRRLARKPVPNRQSSYQVSNNEHAPVAGHIHNCMKQPVHKNSNPRNEDLVSAERRGRTAARPDARNDKPSRPVSLVASRAVSRARSVTRDIKSFFRRESSVEPQSSRRTYKSTQDLKGNVAATPTVDRGDARARSISFEYFYNKVSSSLSSNQRRGSRQMRQSIHTDSVPGFASDVSNNRTRSNSQDCYNYCENSESAPIRKPVIDLNRALPPLPSIDQWKDTQDDVEPHFPPDDYRTTNDFILQQEDQPRQKSRSTEILAVRRDPEPQGVLRRSEHGRRLERQSYMPTRMSHGYYDMSHASSATEDTSYSTQNWPLDQEYVPPENYVPYTTEPEQFQSMDYSCYLPPHSARTFPITHAHVRASSKPRTREHVNASVNASRDILDYHDASADPSVMHGSTFPSSLPQSKGKSKWKWWQSREQRAATQQPFGGC